MQDLFLYSAIQAEQKQEWHHTHHCREKDTGTSLVLHFCFHC